MIIIIQLLTHFSTYQCNAHTDQKSRNMARFFLNAAGTVDFGSAKMQFFQLEMYLNDL